LDLFDFTEDLFACDFFSFDDWLFFSLPACADLFECDFSLAGAALSLLASDALEPFAGAASGVFASSCE
jgi:hypothetical protein